MKTIEALSLTKTSGDLWDEFSNQIQNPNSLTLHFAPEQKVTVRLIGPFVAVQRFYLPFLSLSCPKDIVDIDAITDKKPEAIDKAIKYYSDLKRAQPYGSVELNRAIEYLKKMAGLAWQKCIMINAYQKPNGQPATIKIMTSTRILNDTIVARTHNNPDALLSGLYAHDISIIRRGEGLNTRYEVELLQPTHLADTDVNFILNEGLIDIPTLIDRLNKSTSTSYRYRMATSYKMPEEFTKALMKERVHFESDRAVSHVEERLNDIPFEAFERRNNMRDAIRSLEL